LFADANAPIDITDPSIQEEEDPEDALKRNHAADQRPKLRFTRIDSHDRNEASPGAVSIVDPSSSPPQALVRVVGF
jgi:hypothetical protein